MIRRRLLAAPALCLSLLLTVLLVWPCLAQVSVLPDLGHPALRGLAAWWRGVPGFTGSTQLYNLVRGGMHGTLTNMGFSPGSGWSPSTRPGGTARINFSGVSDYVSLGDDPLYDFADTTFTVTTWFRATACSGGCYLIAMRLIDTPCGVTCGGWFVRVNADGSLAARIVDGGNVSAGERGTVSTTALTGEWHQVAAVFTTDTTTLANNDVSLYLDGVLNQQARTDSGAGAYNVLHGWPLVLGSVSDQSAGSFLIGSIDDVQLYTRGLTALEVWQRYQQGLQGEQAVFQQIQPLLGLVVPKGTTGTFFPFFH